MANARSQKVCVWAGIAGIGLFFIGYWVMAGLVPPPSPHWSAEHVQRFWDHHVSLKRYGLVLCMLGGALTAPWVAAIAVQMRRIEGEHSPYTWTQLGTGMLGVLLFIFPIMVMQAILFRPHRDPSQILLLNDVAWLPFVGIFMPASVQCLAIGLAIFKDKEEKVFPRWLGYFNVWVALLFLPDVLIYSFKTGAFSWRGAITFWMPLSVFGLWFAVMLPYLLKAISAQQRETETSATTVPGAAAAVATS
jgi:hypothetical protein